MMSCCLIKEYFFNTLLLCGFYYAPNFEEVAEAYWFRVVRPCMLGF